MAVVREGATYRSVKLQAAVEPSRRVEQVRSAMLLGHPLLPLISPHKRTMVLVGYGPSLARKLDEIAAEEGDLFTVSGAHDFLLANGVVPMAHIECDPRPHKAKLLQHPHSRVVYMLATCCAPEMFAAVHGKDVNVWHNAGSPEEDEIVRSLDPNGYLVCGATTVQSRAISLGSALGYRDFDLYAFDCCYKDGRQHAGAHPNVSALNEQMRVRVADSEYDTSVQLFKAAQDFLWQHSQMVDCTFTIHGDGLLAQVVKAMNIPRCTVLA